jgi:subtilisin family serine protease
LFRIALLTLSIVSQLANPPYWIGQLDLVHAWTSTKGSGVTVGLVDTGVNSDAQGLTNIVLAGAQFPNLGADIHDYDGHGTKMAQIISGVAPEIRILPAKLSGGADQASAAIRWVVDHGAKVVNLSLGSGLQHSTAFDDGLRYAQEHDVVIVAAAGNSMTDSGVTSPADRPGVVAVSAVDKDGNFSSGISVQGTGVTLAAPGVDVLDASGTSESAAIVSGVVALVRSKFPELNAANVINRLIRTAVDHGSPGRDPQYGFGVVNPSMALTATLQRIVVNPLGTLARTETATSGSTFPWQTLLWSICAVIVAMTSAWLAWCRRIRRRSPTTS